MKPYLKKFIKFKKRKLIKKTIGVVGTAWCLNFGRINQNKNHYSPTAINPTQKSDSLLKTDIEEIKTKSAGCIQVKTGSGTVLAISKGSSDELQQVTLVKDGNNSKPTTVVGQAHGFTQHPRTTRKPRGTTRPGRPIQPAHNSEFFRSPHSISRNTETPTQLEAKRNRNRNSGSKKSNWQNGSGKKKGSGKSDPDDSTLTSIGKRTDSEKRKMRSDKIHKQFVGKKKKRKM